MNLRPGDTIGICAPSSYVLPDVVEKACAVLEQRGFRTRVHPQTFARIPDAQPAGTHDEKLKALHDLYADPEVKAVISAGGGNRALHLLDRLDWDLIRANPKPYMGYSDSTALLNALPAKAGIRTVHGPMMKRISEDTHPEELNLALSLLSGAACDIPLTGAKVLNEGSASGPAFGGNLSVFQFLPGTPFLPEVDGAILFFEDVNEEINHLDRILLYFRRIGLFSRAAGLIFGQFSHLKDTGRPFGISIDELIAEHTQGLDIPILTHAPFGHAAHLVPLPLGFPLHLTAHSGKIRLTSTGGNHS